MQRRHSGANADQLPNDSLNSPREHIPRKNSASATSVSDTSRVEYRNKKRWSRQSLIFISAFISFFILLEFKYQCGCDVSESFSLSTSDIGSLTLSVLSELSLPHWLAFGSLLEALFLAEERGDEKTILASKKGSKSMGIDYHVSTLEVAVDITNLNDTAFWNLVTKLESHHLHVVYDRKHRVMYVYEKDDAVKDEPPSKYIPKWTIPEPYHEGKPHSIVWFLHLDKVDDTSIPAMYSIQQIPGAENHKRIFAKDDILPLKSTDFLGRKVFIPHNGHKIAAQEFSRALHDGIKLKGRSQCFNELFRGDLFYNSILDQMTWYILWGLTTFFCFKGLQTYIFPSRMMKGRVLSEADGHKVFV